MYIPEIFSCWEIIYKTGKWGLLSQIIFLSQIISHYSSNYKVEKAAFRRILKNNIFEVNVNLKVLIYYKSKKISNLLISNNLCNPIRNVPHDQKSVVVYEFTCNLGECNSLTPKNSYIGLTTCTLKERFRHHRYQGSIFKHLRDVHDHVPTGDDLCRATKILYTSQNKYDLNLYEALFIRKYRPKIERKIGEFWLLES